jgi:hypothetical protein
MQCGRKIFTSAVHLQPAAAAAAEAQDEGLHGMFKRPRHNGHQLMKGSCDSSALTVTQNRLKPAQNTY